MRALVLTALALATACADRPLDLPENVTSRDLGRLDAAVDLADLAQSSTACGATSCGPSQVCVHPTCCIGCFPYDSTGPDGGVCPAGTIAGGPCSNIIGPCSQPCTPDPEFCVDAPAGCAALDPNLYCNDQGQEGGFCDNDILSCIECF